MAACDADCKFTLVDVGAYGSQSDGGIQRTLTLAGLLNGGFPLPSPRALPNSDLVLPFFFLGDAAFPLNKQIMRPYPGLNLDSHKEYTNYRISRARITIERAYGN